MRPPPPPPLLLLLAPPPALVLGVVPVFLLLEQAASPAAAAPPMPRSIERRLTLARALALGGWPGDGSVSGMTPPRGVRREKPPAGRTSETFFNVFDQN